MGKLVYDVVSYLFGQRSIGMDVNSIISWIFDALSAFFDASAVSGALSIFTGLAYALVVLFFYIDLSGKAQREMLTFQILLIQFIKLVMAVIVIAFLPEIITGLMGLCKGVYSLSSNSTVMSSLVSSGGTQYNIKFFGQQVNLSYGPDGAANVEWPPYEGEMEKALKKEYGFSIRTLFEDLGTALVLGIIYIISFLAVVPGYVVCISNALSLVVRIIYAPIAVAQMFEEGSRSAGIRYLKKLVATGMAFAIIAGIVLGGQLLSSTIIVRSIAHATGIREAATSVNLNINRTTLRSTFLSPQVAFTIIAVQIAQIGAMMKAPSLANDIVGV